MSKAKSKKASATTASKSSLIDQGASLLKKYQADALEQVATKRTQITEFLGNARVSTLTEVSRRIGKLSDYVGELAKKG